MPVEGRETRFERRDVTGRTLTGKSNFPVSNPRFQISNPGAPGRWPSGSERAFQIGEVKAAALRAQLLECSVFIEDDCVEGAADAGSIVAYRARNKKTGAKWIGGDRRCISGSG